MNSLLIAVGGTSFGAGLMYFFDPARGRRRRALVRDQVRHMWAQSGDAVLTTRRDAGNRASGLWSIVHDQRAPRPFTDDVIAERVRAALGRVSTHPHAIRVTVAEGQAQLTGPVLNTEADDVIRAARRTHGVTSVLNDLEIHETPGSVPGLQGLGRRRESQVDFLQSNWSPTARAVGGLTGSALAIVGARRRGIGGAVLAISGITLVARAAANYEVSRLAGIGGRQRGIVVRKTLNVRAPVEQVFALWAALPDYPRFMSHVREVTDLGDGRYHWVVAGPAGVPVAWDAVVTELTPNQRLRWKSLPGAIIEQSGVTRFDSNPDGSTRMTIQLRYNPPVGAVGHAVATILGHDPKHVIDDDLVRFKSLIEQGHTTAHGTRVTLDNLPVWSEAQTPTIQREYEH